MRTFRTLVRSASARLALRGLLRLLVGLVLLGRPDGAADRRANATALADETFDFQEGGVSGFVLLAESHISIHTWPEHRYAAVDIYTCGEHTVPEKACAALADRHAVGECRGERGEHAAEAKLRDEPPHRHDRDGWSRRDHQDAQRRDKGAA